MTKERAVFVLRDCYGSNPGQPIPPDVEAAFTEAKTKNKWPESFTVLDWLQRIVGDDYNWRHVRSWGERAAHFAKVCSS